MPLTAARRALAGQSQPRPAPPPACNTTAVLYSATSRVLTRRAPIAVARREAAAAQHAERVVEEGAQGLQRRAHDPGLDVRQRLPANAVNHCGGARARTRARTHRSAVVLDGLRVDVEEERVDCLADQQSQPQPPNRGGDEPGRAAARPRAPCRSESPGCACGRGRNALSSQ
jgi:hypothetical protein